MQRRTAGKFPAVFSPVTQWTPIYCSRSEIISSEIISSAMVTTYKGEAVFAAKSRFAP
jgi:hypothetical protein